MFPAFLIDYEINAKALKRIMKRIRFALNLALACLLIVLLSQNVYSQTTKLTYKVKGKTTYAVDIVLSSQDGNESVSPEDYFTYEDIYFIFKPSVGSSKKVFRESDITDILAKVTLTQSQNISQSKQPKYLLNDKGKINRIIVAYPKSGFVAYEKFSFSSGGYFSDKIQLEEKYLENFKKYSDLLEKAKKQYESGAYNAAFSNYLTIVNDGLNSTEISSFSFYKSVTDKYIPETVDYFIDQSKTKYEDVNAKFEADKGYKSLSECGKVMDQIQQDAKIFDGLKKIDTPEVKGILFKLNDFIEGLKRTSSENTTLFEKEKMSFLENKSYDDYKFRVFIDLFARMILFKESLSLVNEIDVIEENRLNKFPEKKKELLKSWEADFQIYIELINQNIRTNGHILNDAIMENLNNLVETQRQPYYEIFAAFNTMKSDPEESKSHFHTALTKCSDESMIDYIEYWLLSHRLTENQIDPEFLKQINEGKEMINKKRYSQADNLFNQLMRMASGFAPTWFHSGEIKYHLGESYSAERFFNKALEIYPHYIAPRKFILRIFESDSSYKQYLENANKALGKFDIWYFNFHKAKALYFNGKYDETISEINDKCLVKNPWDLEQYYLLGDAYFQKGDYKQAKTAYGKILDINPYLTDTKKFDERMRRVSKKMEEKPAEKKEEKPQ